MAHIAELVLVSEDGRRGAKRRLVNFASSVRDGATQSLKIRVTDLSISGCKISSEGELHTDQEVWIKLTGMVAIRAHVVWLEDGQAGCKFCVPIDPVVLESFVVSQRKNSKEIFHRREVPPKVASRPGARWRLFG